MEWTEGALAKLQDKLRQSPPIALEFVTDMLKRDSEDLAREKGLTRIDEEVLRELWEAPLERVSWTDEAWKRLMEDGGAELRAQRDEARRLEGDDSGKVQAIDRMLEQLGHLKAFALPVIGELADLVVSARAVAPNNQNASHTLALEVNEEQGDPVTLQPRPVILALTLGLAPAGAGFARYAIGGLAYTAKLALGGVLLALFETAIAGASTSLMGSLPNLPCNSNQPSTQPGTGTE